VNSDSTEKVAPRVQPKPESYFWPLLSLVVVIVPQVAIPARLRLGPIVAVPIVEGIVVLILLGIAAKRGPVPARLRPLILTLFSILVVANASAAGRLVSQVMKGTPAGHHPPSATRLLVATGMVLATNIVTFALLYWQIDAGGPDARRSDEPHYPDFQFPQTGDDEIAPPGWVPRFGDYLYAAFNNIVTFAPVDALPLTGRTKLLTAVQSVISVTTLILVLARVINLLPQ